ncbi:hypothetical protein ACFL40_03545 [candidate division KSB1 bacterium]
MIKINLLGQVKRPKKPREKKEKLKIPISRKHAYIGLLLVSVVFLLYIYVLSPEPEAEISVVPQPVQPKPPPPSPAAPDTAQQPAPVVKEEPPPPKPEPKKEISDDYIVRAASINRNQIDGYCILRDAVPKGINYTLITVAENSFISELLTRNSLMVDGFKNNLSKKRLKIAGVNISKGSLHLTTHIWGSLQEGSVNPNNVSIEKFQKPAEIIRKMRSIARKSGCILKTYRVKEPVPYNTYKLSPVMLKFYGSDEKTIAFLKTVQKERDNFVLVKISGVPDPVRNRVQIALNLEVFMPE